MICKPCSFEADDRREMGDEYIDRILDNEKRWGHYCGHKCCQTCDCQHHINTGGMLRND